MRRCVAMLLIFGLLATGCERSETVDRAKELTSRAGRAIGEGVGTFVSGVNAGYEKAITAYEVRISKELLAKGVSVSVSKQAEEVVTNASQTTLSLYVINRQPVSGTLRIKLFSATTQEIGRATAAVALPADNARYVPFGVDKEIPLTLTKFIELDLKKE